MHKSLPPLPSSPPGPSIPHAVWPQLPPDRRQQCHALLAQLLIDVSHSAPSEECTHEPQASPEPSPT
jgi:hypothetical protein